MTDTSHHHRHGTGTHRRPRAGWYSSPPSRGRYPSSPPRDRYPSRPPRGMYRSPSPRGRYRPASQDRLQPRQVRFEQDDYASGRTPTASAIIASASVQGAPRIRVHVKAYEAASVEALPDTGADVSVAGLQFLDDMGEFPENLLPPDEHPKAANGEVIKSIGILPVHTTTAVLVTRLAAAVFGSKIGRTCRRA